MSRVLVSRTATCGNQSSKNVPGDPSMTGGITIKKTLFVVGCLLLAAQLSKAENFFLAFPSGDWTNAANWTDGVVPTNSADVTDGSTAIYTGGGPTAKGHIFIGDSADGTFSFNSGSLTNTAAFGDYGFNIGINAGGSGFLTVAPTAGTLSVMPFVIARDGANGTVTQNGGTVIVNDFMSMGLFSPSGPGGTATYMLNAGTLSVAGDFSVNESSSNTVCTFTQTGGTVLGHNMFIGRGGTGKGVYSISGGNIYATNDDLLVGVVNTGANGTLNVSGSANINVSGIVNGDLVVGADDLATGTVNMANGTVVPNDLIVGRNGGTGTMIQSNGTVTTGGFVVLGLGGPGPDGSGTYQMVGGTLNIAGDFSVNQDYGQTCTFTQSGGMINLTGSNSPTVATTNGGA